MNNNQKFKETKKALIVFQKELEHFEEEASKKEKEVGIESNEYFKAFLTTLRTKELSFDKKGYFVRFESNVFGDYIQPVWRKKNRLNVVPICFLIHLYTENLEVKEITDEKQTEIPFTLRGFWQMEKAEKFVNELIQLQLDFAGIIYHQIEENAIRKTRVKKLNKILEVLESLEIKVINDSKKQQYEITFEDQFFKVNKKNRKLDVVPLCKMITSYYVRAINYLEDYKKLLGKIQYKYEINEMELSFMKMMEKYFTLLLVR